jgi:cardiolipin synthase
LHHWRWIPNALTFLRIALIAPFAMELHAGSYPMALIIFISAAVTDGVDGYLARRFDWRSRFGAIADPLADKALLITAYLMLALGEVFPLWLFLLVLGRDLLIVCGALIFHYGIGRFEMAPSLLGKFNTAIQILAVLLAMLLQVITTVPPWINLALIWMVAAFTVLSGAHYLLAWSLRAWRARLS